MQDSKEAKLGMLLMAVVLAGCAHEGTYTCVRLAAGVGESCGEDTRCERGAGCVEGVCEWRAEHGEPCDGAIGRYCREPYLCESGACVGPLADEGRACEPDSVDSCASGLRCLGAPSPRCLPQVGDGERCFVETQCPDGSVCRGLRCGPPGGLMESCFTTARACAAGLGCAHSPDGSLCLPPPSGEGDYCREGTCPDGLTCLRNPEGGRHCIFDLEQGFECLPYSLHEHANCASDLFCHRDTLRCTPVAGPGEVCVSQGDDPACAGEDFHCRLSEDGSLRCQPPVSEGGSCINGETCGRNTSCDKDRDAPRIGFGSGV